MRIDIIGGGVAGLSLGIYLQKNGFETTIYEQHSVAGGLCTGWKRDKYTFNGCLHWILGTQTGISFYDFWREIIDIDDVDVIYHTERVEFELPIADKFGNNVFHFKNDIDEFEKYMLDIAPEDEKIIRYWAKQVRFIIPRLKYLPPVFIDESWYSGIGWKSKMVTLFPMLFFMLKWSRYSNRDFAQRFKNPFLRMAVERLYESEMRMTVLLFAQAYATSKVSGYPLGGSLNFVQRLVNQYQKKGGRLLTQTKIEKVRVENDKAVGLILGNGQQTTADFVVSAADWHWTIFEALDGKYHTKSQKELLNPSENKVFNSFCMLFLGVAKSLTEMPHFFRFPVSKFISPDGTEYEQLEVHVYNYDSLLAPEGHTTMSVNLQTRRGQWWIDLRKNNKAEYEKQKKKLTNMLFEMLFEKLGNDFRQYIEVVDLTTPATYHRYTNNLRGSSQGWSPLNNILKQFCVTPQQPRLKNFMMVGHWQKAGGGLPVAIHTARCIAWKICNIFGKRFKNK